MDEILLSIGQLARICNVTPKTLRYYDKVGLLKPAKINSENGYRFYFKSHITRVLAIKQLQEIGVSLEQIGRFYKKNFSSNLVGGLDEMLRIQEKEIISQMEELSKKQSKIKMIQSQCKDISDKLSEYCNESFIKKELTDRNIIYKEYSGKHSPDIYRTYYKMILDSVLLSKQSFDSIISPPIAICCSKSISENVIIQIGYQVNEMIELENISHKTINAGLYACDIYHGPYGDKKNKFYDCLYENIRKENYIITGNPIEIYYISEVITDCKSNYLTEIQIPIQ
ncbi:MerR family transcriptional regulator [Anaerocolumna sp. AGMB13025]|uniref:MerR family transcriptional regulator n=1 Tax=Anaerocolumna sp. AGMB13025 TaxID=3039116 RepID=UPI00241E85D5|nr:MerR family transcriptional regulator [Anaerocolumna sp. AGMB13025]WFR56589.1 MerR family transcriptional regulator [Anaerocolumna sp. AGMB13025]